MTALAEQLAAGGRYPSVAVADLAITAGSVFRDANGQVRVAGSATPIQADQPSTAQVPALTLNPGGFAPLTKGTGNHKW